MKRKFTFGGIVMTGMVMIAVFLSSCGSKPNRDTSVIPADAPIVMEINVEKLTLKSNIANYKDQLADMLIATDENDENVLEIAEAIRKMEDGGLDLRKPVYLFTTADVEGAFLLSSIRNTAAVNETILKMGGGKFRVVEDEGDGLSWIENIDNQKTIGVHNGEMLLLGMTEQKDVFAKLITGDGGFFNTQMGRTMAEHAGDITLMVNAQTVNPKVMDALRTRFIQSDEKTGALFANDEIWAEICKLQMVWNLKFSVGEVSLNMFSDSNETNQQVLTKVNSDVFANVPAQGLIGVLAMGIDGEQLAAVLEETMTKEGGEMDNETRMGVMMMTSLCKAMNGSAAFSISMNELSKDMGFVALLPIAQEKLQYIFNMLTADSDNEIYMTGSDTYSAISNKRAYQFGHVNPSFNMGSHAESCYAYGFFDIQQLVNLALASERKSGKPAKKDFEKDIVEYIQMFGYAELKMTSYNELSIILKLNDDKHNSLSVLLEKTFELGIKYLQHQKAQRSDEWTFDEDDAEWDELEEVAW